MPEIFTETLELTVTLPKKTMDALHLAAQGQPVPAGDLQIDGKPFISGRFQDGTRIQVSIEPPFAGCSTPLVHYCAAGEAWTYKKTYAYLKEDFSFIIDRKQYSLQVKAEKTKPAAKPQKGRFVVAYLFTDDLKHVLLTKKPYGKASAQALDGPGCLIKEDEEPRDALRRAIEQDTRISVDSMSHAVWLGTAMYPESCRCREGASQTAFYAAVAGKMMGPLFGQKLYSTCGRTHCCWCSVDELLGNNGHGMGSGMPGMAAGGDGLYYIKQARDRLYCIQKAGKPLQEKEGTNEQKMPETGYPDKQ